MNTDQAVSHFGSKRKLADALEISPSAVTLWGQVVPRLRQFQIQMLTCGLLKAEPVILPTVKRSSSSNVVSASGPDGAVHSSSTNQALRRNPEAVSS